MSSHLYDDANAVNNLRIIVDTLKIMKQYLNPNLGN